MCPGCNTTLMCPQGSTIVRCTCQMLLKVPPPTNPTSPGGPISQPQYAPPTVTGGPAPVSYSSSNPPPANTYAPPPPPSQIQIPCFTCGNHLLIPTHVSRVVCPFCQSYMEISTMPSRGQMPLSMNSSNCSGQNNQVVDKKEETKEEKKEDKKTDSSNPDSSPFMKIKGLLKKKDKNGAYGKVGDDDSDGVELLDAKEGETYKNANSASSIN